jgi:hypothetical protein
MSQQWQRAVGDVVFSGTMADSEDPTDRLQLRWDARPIQPAGPPLPPVLDSTLAVFPLVSVGSNRTIYEIEFRATDRGGLKGKPVIRILIVP